MRFSALWGIAALAFSLVSAQIVSRTARCGPQYGLTCQGSRWGNCCSKYSYCGSTLDYCGDGCQTGWGTCNSSPSLSSTIKSSTTSARSASAPIASPMSSSSTRTASSAAASSTLKVTTNARCGKGYGFTCQGSQWGDCCSQYSYCGVTDAYCGQGCQQSFGKCNPVSSSSAATLSTQASSSSVLSSSQASSSSPTASTSAFQSSPAVSSSILSSSQVSSSSLALSTSASQSTPAVSSSVSSSTQNVASSSFSVASSVVTSSSQVPSSLNTIVPSSSSATLSASATPCTAPLPIVMNGDFETGNQAPFVPDSAVNQYWTFTVPSSGGHDSAHHFSGVTSYTSSSVGYEMTQIITIPDAGLYEASAWVRVRGSAQGQVTFKWFLSNSLDLGDGTLTLRGGEGWVKCSTGFHNLRAGLSMIQLQVIKFSGPLDLAMDIDDYTLNSANPLPACVSSSQLPGSTSSLQPSSTLSTVATPSASSSSIILIEAS